MTVLFVMNAVLFLTVRKQVFLINWTKVMYAVFFLIVRKKVFLINWTK